MRKTLLSFLATLAGASLFVGRPSLPLDLTPGTLAPGEAAVRKAEADRAAMAGSAGVDAWMAFYATDAIVHLPNDGLASGREPIHDAVTRLLALPQLSVALHQVKVEMARSGDLAYLIGEYELRFGDSRGAPLRERGSLHELWRKQNDGTWKCAVDLWNSVETSGARAAPPPPAKGLASEAPAADPETGPLRQSRLPATKYGDMPIHYEATIRQFFQEHLKNPESVQYQEITKPEHGYTTAISGTLLMRETRDYGWTVNVTINAKNSRGSYAGFKRYTFLFRGETLIRTLSPVASDELN